MSLSGCDDRVMSQLKCWQLVGLSSGESHLFHVFIFFVSLL